jgi:class 3 adenylate cyclase
VPGGSQLDVLLTLLGTRADGAIDGDTVMRRLGLAGHDVRASTLLSRLLELETAGLVEVQRAGGYRFALSARGEDAAYELGPGDPIDVVLVMLDLVGYVAFTSQHGDAAAHDAARRLHDLADVELRRAGGKVVKHLGDGFLGTVCRPADGVACVRTIAARCERPDGQRWAVRAAVHRGRPIAFRGDLFGADVNLASRLCAAAEPGQLLVTTTVDDPHAESIAVRGLPHPIAATRVLVP